MRRDILDLDNWEEYLSGVYQYNYDGYTTFEILLNHTCDKNSGAKRTCGKGSLYASYIEMHEDKTWELNREEIIYDVTVAACLTIAKRIVSGGEDE